MITITTYIRFGQERSLNLVFFNQLDYSNAKPTPKEKYIISGLEELGFEWFVEEYRDLRSKDKKKPKDIKVQEARLTPQFSKYWINIMTVTHII